MSTRLETVISKGLPVELAGASRSSEFLTGSTWIVLPTYNERPNLEPLLTDIFRQPDLQVLVVDDRSPDGTGELAEQLRQRWSNLFVLHRPGKAGLAAAYRQGLTVALQRGAERIIHMDADRSHDPGLIPVIRRALETADLVVASRYVPGGTLAIPWHRRLISQVGNRYISWLLGGQVHDWSTGYCGWRAAALEAALAVPSPTVGYAWLIEMKWQAVQRGGRVVEVPLAFRDRTAGASKFSGRIMWEDIQTAWRLRRGR